MQNLLPLILALAMLGMVVCGNSFASGTKKAVLRRGILLVAFGTSAPEAQKSFDQIDLQTRKAFPETEIRWAFTSKTIRGKLAKQGKPVNSPGMALAAMMDEGFTHVAVLSLHAIPGIEFHELQRNAGLFGQMAGGFEKILVARPLLSSHEDMERVAAAMRKRIPPGRSPADAVLLMGHGSAKHPSDAIYAAMSYILQQSDPNVYVATVDGYPAINDILPKLAEKKVKKVYLVPFMTVAGDHARKDMVGEGPESWKSILEKNGMTTETVLKGIAEYPEIVDIWLDHLRQIFSDL